MERRTAENGFFVAQMKEDHLAAVTELDEKVFPLEKWGREAFRKNLENAFDHCFVVLQEDREAGNSKVAGFAVLRTLDPAELLLIATDPSLRRKGAGTALLEAVIRKANEEKTKSLLLEVRAANIAALSLYQKSGFRQISVRKNYYDHPCDDAIIMQRTEEG